MPLPPTNIIVGAFVFFMLVFQNVVSSSTHVNGLSIDLAFMQAVSFITNTDLQHYAGDQSFSVISQMVVLTFAMFVSSASGIAVCVCFYLRFYKKELWAGYSSHVYFIENPLTPLLPVAFGFALLLMVLGVPQRFIGYNQSYSRRTQSNFCNRTRCFFGIY